ncbi:outer membrane beta-barrel protein [Marinigracilibium pacificum]|uniref:Porin n=1 Tax=Marinigracilibium pacificum TaxID=2729599 RepID=A0A848J254_9BACT|nr:outer membrane beta-barrel protein [Marinigracilibium pacificum]NMM47272.1 porin [Marinigracilibium pacificum]
MKNATLLLLTMFLVNTAIFAQDTEIVEEMKSAGLQISGSADIYYKYDFSGESNVPTSFADVQNSIAIGMLDIGLSHSTGKVSFVGEFSFGPRSFKSIPTLEDGSGTDRYINIQNLYMSYALTDKLTLTGGYMGTFVGYEVISPAGNFNYSTSYLFTNGPFQNAGFKAEYAFSDKFSLMAGIFNDWNVYEDNNGVTDFGAQLYVSPVEGWDVYINYLNGSPSGSVLDLTTGFQITDAFYLGANAATYSADGIDAGGYSGVALYPQYSFSDKVSVGYRGEFFSFKEYVSEGVTIPSESVFSSTLTLNYYSGPMTFLTEVRFDNAENEWFVDGDVDPSKSASQLLFAAIYSF